MPESKCFKHGVFLDRNETARAYNHLESGASVEIGIRQEREKALRDPTGVMSVSLSLHSGSPHSKYYTYPEQLVGMCIGPSSPASTWSVELATLGPLTNLYMPPLTCGWTWLRQSRAQ